MITMKPELPLSPSTHQDVERINKSILPVLISTNKDVEKVDKNARIKECCCICWWMPIAYIVFVICVFGGAVLYKHLNAENRAQSLAEFERRWLSRYNEMHDE